MQPAILKEKLLIDGQKCPSYLGESFDLENPANGKVFASMAEAAPEDVERAINSSHQCFSETWQWTLPRERRERLLTVAQLLRSGREALAILQSRNIGKPLKDSRRDVDFAADCFEFFAGIIEQNGGRTIPANVNGFHFTSRVPHGVCALILPWSNPLTITAFKSAAALAAGNTVILKPASISPLLPLAIGDILLQAGFPPGACNVITGRGSSIGENLVRHPLVAKISFTGSTEVGKDVMRMAIDEVKPVTMELAGKSANIVFADADIDEALAGAIKSALINAGQDCQARTRLLVQKPIYDSFCKALTQAFSAVKIGDPLAEATEMGPLISPAQRERVEKYIELGSGEGAQLLYGGDIPADETLREGAYLNPALFSDVDSRMYIAKEEIFGPVLCVMPFEDEREAVEIANASIYGLTASVWSRDGEKALRVCRHLKVGYASINSGVTFHPEVPFGGMKQSGLGRELGLAALRQYSELKSVYYNINLRNLK